MLVSGSKLTHTPVLSLQTGTRLGVTKEPVIDPSNLKILAYMIEGPSIKNKTFIRIDDIREISSLGMIIDSADELVELEDVIKIKQIHNLNFKLFGINVIDEKNHKLGKVEDYNINTKSFTIDQLSVNRGMLKSLSQSNLLVHRSQILEIDDYKIKIRSATEKEKLLEKEEGRFDYLNPFRSATPSADN